MNLTNYHSHCSFCDGKAPMEEFVKSAISAGFTSYGISSHAPLPFQARWTLDKACVQDYLGEIERLKEVYGEKIDLYAGLEIDYLNGDQNPAIAYFQELPLDYRIGSVHLVYTPDGEIVDTDTNPENFKRIVEEKFGGNLRKTVEAYFEALSRMVEAGGFDFVGHPNKIWYNAGLCEAGVVSSDWYQQLLGDFYRLVSQKGVMLEINTKAFLVRHIFFPDVEDWKKIRALHIPVVVNSDAHRPELVNSGRMEALKLLKENGFEQVREMNSGKWVDVKIED